MHQFVSFLGKRKWHLPSKIFPLLLQPKMITAALDAGDVDYADGDMRKLGAVVEPRQ